jgi:AAA domain (dynein-related subfamily)
MTTETKPEQTPAKGFEILCRLLAPNIRAGMSDMERTLETKSKGDTQKRVMAHIRAVTGLTIALPVYHNNPDFTDADKMALYRECIEAIVKKNWALLKGQVGVGDKRVDPVEAIEEVALPAAQPVPVEAEAKPEPKPADMVTAAIIEIEATDDDLTKAILKRIIPRLPKPGLDVDGIKRLVAGEVPFHVPNVKEQVKEALGNGAFPVDRVKAIVKDAIAELGIQRIAVVQPSGATVEVGRQHYKFPLLLAAVSQRLNVMLVGGAGGGKTTVCGVVAEALGLPFEAMSIGPMTSKADFFGFKDATGEYHDTPLVRRATEGGVFLVDEVDTGGGGSMTTTNMVQALRAGEKFATPDGMKEKHKDFLLIAGANTYGQGADRVYVGRNQLDGATLDRYVMIDWDYDEGFEAALCGVSRPSPKLDLAEGGILTPEQWFDRVIAIRRAVESLKLRVIVSPRANFHGNKLFAAGVGQTHVERCVIWKGMDAATREKVAAAIN